MIRVQIRFQKTAAQKKKLLEEDNEEEDKNWEDMDYKEKISYIVEFPFDWIRKITMPPSEAENYDKHLVIIWPFPGIIFILWGTQILTLFTFYIGFLGSSNSYF